MRYNFKPNNKTQYNQILIVGSGLSLEYCDLSNIITEQTIIIALNASATVLPKIDYFILSNWITLRSSVMDYIPKDTTILCYAGMSGSDVILSNDFIPSLNIKIFDVITQKLLHRQPAIIHFHLSRQTLLNATQADQSIEIGHFAGGYGAGPIAFSLALYLMKHYNIQTIYYTGVDFVNIGSKQYPNCLTIPISKINKANACGPPEFSRHPFMIESYKYQFLATLLIASLSKSFYSKLLSLSALNIHQYDYQTLHSIRLNLLDNLKRYKLNTPNPVMLDDILRDLNENRIKHQLKENLKTLSLSGSKDHKQQPKRYKPETPKGFLQ